MAAAEDNLKTKKSSLKWEKIFNTVFFLVLGNEKIDLDSAPEFYFLSPWVSIASLT